MKVDRMLLAMVLANVARQSENQDEIIENLAQAIEAGDVFEKGERA